LPGDEFKILVEKRIAEGDLVGYGDIVAAEYRSADRPALSAVRFPDTDGSPRHYDYQGQATRKMFLRAPLEFTRITSGYSHARRHPILGGLRPHLAIDYGAPTGTPVRAVADGVVVASGRAGGYGLSVTVRHAQGYETMYNHCRRRWLPRGMCASAADRASRRDGLPPGRTRPAAGTAGLDPLSEKFIAGEPVPRDARAFQAQVQWSRTSSRWPAHDTARTSHPGTEA
jgi:hypothetical protein